MVGPKVGQHLHQLVPGRDAPDRRELRQLGAQLPELPQLWRGRTASPAARHHGGIPRTSPIAAGLSLLPAGFGETPRQVVR